MRASNAREALVDALGREHARAYDQQDDPADDADRSIDLF